MPPRTRKLAVPYVPFKTFIAAIERFEHGLPNQIDSSVWESYSGAIRSQLLGAFRFLGLVDPRGRPTDTLRSLVEDRASRKASLRRVIEASYKPIIALGLQKVTRKQFRDAMSEFGGVSGATQKKIISFFLRAARYCDLPMSATLTKKVVGATPRRAVRDSREDQVPAPSVAEVSKTTALRSGGKLTLHISANLIDLSVSDRTFVFNLIDKLESYARAVKRDDNSE